MMEELENYYPDLTSHPLFKALMAVDAMRPHIMHTRFPKRT